MSGWAGRDAQAIAAAVRGGEASAVEVVEAHLARIAALEPALHAFLQVTADAARAAAAAVDRQVAAGHDPGPLAGVPLGIKDNLCLEGVETTAGSRALAGFRPPYTATAVARLVAAGAVPVGKLNLDEFSMGSSTENSAFGPTKNPWDLERVPGGSSGGSAAAVAAGEVPLALGSDTGGSIRQPAALCGCVGVKPTYGLVSRYGLIAFASSLDQVGPLARTTADAALALDALWGPDPYDATSRDPREAAAAGARASLWGGPAPFAAATARGALQGKVLGVVRAWRELTTDPEVRAQVEAAVEAARAAGAEVREVDLDLAQAAVPAYQLVATAEASSNLARYDGVHYGARAQGAPDAVAMSARTRDAALGAEVKRRILLGTFVLSSGYYEAYYLRAMRVRRRIRADLERALDGVDALVGPTSPEPAFRLGEKARDPLALYAVDVMTVAINLADLPAVSLPCGFTGAGLPVGLQLVGARWSDPALLEVAAGFERALALPARRPAGLPPSDSPPDSTPDAAQVTP